MQDSHSGSMCPDQCLPTMPGSCMYLLADAPVIMIGARGVASQRVIFGPASTAGVWLHAISLVRVITMPPHEVVAVTVKVAVNEALGTEGVKYARAGLLFCVHVPRPAPPVHTADCVSTGCGCPGHVDRVHWCRCTYCNCRTRIGCRYNINGKRC